jgi:hypothetical protein
MRLVCLLKKMGEIAGTEVSDGVIDTANVGCMDSDIAL